MYHVVIFKLFLVLAVSPVIPGQLQSNATTNNACQVPASQFPEPLSPISPVHRYIPLIIKSKV